MKKLTHIDKKGRPRMVDVGSKPLTERMAVARGSVYMKKETFELIKSGRVSKGDVLNVAKLAGIMAAKKTSEIIPLCHPLNITSVDIDFKLVGDSSVGCDSYRVATRLSETLRDEKKSRIDIESRVKITGQTGVEMEALTAVSAAALTIYDMCKAVDKGMVISDIMLMEKRGGKSGEYRKKRE